MFEQLLMGVFEASLKFMEIKDRRNPLIKNLDRAEEFAYMELKNAIKDVEEYLKTED